MRVLVRSTFTLSMFLMLLVGSTALVSAAHNGNNKAELVGTGDPDATGQAVVNYREGTGTFNGTVTVRNLEPGETYTFMVRGATGETFICEDEANSVGTFTCSAQNLTLPGFGSAAVRDSSGNEVATGVFERRGNCRDADQAGSQCKAPDRNK